MRGPGRNAPPATPAPQNQPPSSHPQSTGIAYCYNNNFQPTGKSHHPLPPPDPHSPFQPSGIEANDLTTRRERTHASPLPKGEDQGEGEGTTRTLPCSIRNQKPQKVRDLSFCFSQHASE